ncbi:hypothetical protein Tco_0242222, partial [Tanacetum coccineum]
MAVAAQNINNTTIRLILQQEKLTGPNFTNYFQNLRIVLRSEGKLVHLEQPMTPLLYPVASQAARDTYEALYDAQNEVACLMLGSMSPELQRTLKNYKAYDMIQELKTIKLLSLEDEELPGHFRTPRLCNAKRTCMGKTIAELHAMLKLHEKCIQKKVETPAVLAIQGGKIQKDKKKPQGAKGKAKGKNKLAHAPKTKIPSPPKRDNPEKDSIYHYCKEGLSRSRKLKHGALSLYIGNGMRAAVEAIRSFDLILPSGLIIEEAAYILGIKIIRDRSKRLIALSQSAYLKKILKKFRMKNSKKDDTKSQMRYVFILNGGAVDWKSAKQSTTTMSTTKAEYIVAAEASMEAVWMRKFINGIGGVMPSNKRPMKMLCDNEPALAIASDPGILKGARHFQRKYHYIHEVIQEGEILLKKVHTDDNVADPFTNQCHSISILNMLWRL